MILNKCYIESFGILEKREFDFESGLNCIISDNGTGKSTLAAFIKAMLFGLNTDNKSDISKNERRKYSPWGSGRYGGSLTLTVDGVRYRIERDFGERAAADKFRLYFADTGMPTDRYSENIGMEILGIDREGFERTLLLSERMITGEEGINSVRTKLSDLVGVDGDAGGSEEALYLLENKKKIYSRRSRTSEISLLDGRLAEKKTELEALKDEAATIEAVSEEIAEERRKKADLDRRHGELLKAQSAAESAERVERDRIALNDKTKKLAAVREELRLHEDFFAEGVPSVDEITKACGIH